MLPYLGKGTTWSVGLQEISIKKFGKIFQKFSQCFFPIPKQRVWNFSLYTINLYWIEKSEI